MKKQTGDGARSACRLTRLAIPALLLVGASAVLAENDPAARFHGAPTYDLAVTNVKWEAATEGYSHVTFDLSWSFSWRAKWTEPAERNVTGKPLEVENWDAAWVFVKFLPEKDSKKSIERNHWQHATLSTDPAHHVMPAGATNAVGLTDDGERGVGVFIYRDAIGHGNNDFKGVKLRWLHGADKVEPAEAAVQVHTLAMVYVPEGSFKAGTCISVGLDKFADGPRRPVVGAPLPGHNHPEWPAGCFGAFADGAWRGGEPLIPFLVDAEWSGPVAEGSRARRIGPRPGQLWGNLVFDFHNRGLSCGWGSMDPVNDDYPPATLHNDYPTGYDAFYCSKYPLTQGEYAAFLNSLPPDVAAKRAFVSGDGEMPSSGVTTAFVVLEKRKVSPGPGYRPYTIEEWDGHTITCSGDKVPKIPISVDAGAGDRLDGLDTDPAEDDGILDGLMKDAMADEKGKKEKGGPGPPPVFTARLPDRPCGWIGWVDGFAYAVWAGLRPMTELEYEKVRRGPRDPVRKERASGTKNPKTAADQAREALGATYWGSRGLGGTPITVGASIGRAFRGTHGDGTTPAGDPGAPLRRTGYRFDPGSGFDTAPDDWPKGVEGGQEGVGGRAYIGIRPFRYPRTRRGFGRTAPAAHKPMPTKPRRPPQVAAKADLPGDLPPEAPPADAIKVKNVKWEAGTKDHSFVTFDLAWKNSWRAVWTEPAEKNVTGKPMKIENWDAAWVFVKFRKPGAAGPSHATLSTENDHHQAPAGAALDVGLDNDGDKGLGVFIYRDAAGRGDNNFRNVKLRWLHGADGADPGKVELAAYAIAMVYVDEGPFKSKSPLRQPIFTGGENKRAFAPRLPLTLISTADATQPGGYYRDAGEYVPKHPDWPNGYRALYCMKRSISQGQYAAFLNSVKGLGYNAGRYRLLPMETSRPNNGRLHYARLHGLCGYTIRTDATGAYTAGVPDRPCNFLSWPDIQSYSAWAGLRPPTALEYEKACRGPRDFARHEDAWANGVCAPAAGLPALAAPGASYWGIRQLSLSGCVHEWPGAVGNGVNREGLEFKGTHGNGTPNSPADWPNTTAFGEWFYMSWEAGGSTLGFCSIGIWVIPAQMGRVKEMWMTMDADRTGRYGARAVRTAPLKVDPNAPLEVDRLPNLRGYDIAVFYLSGRFTNNGSKPLKVQLTSPLPDACFPEGAASRAFAAQPNADTPFKIVTVLTRNTLAAVARGGRNLPVRIEGAGGRVLAESVVRLPPSDFKAAGPKVIGSLDGGEVALHILNATDRPRAVKIEMPSPPGVKLSETDRRVEVAAGAEVRASFPVPRQAFGSDRLCRMPYRVTVADGVLQDGETAADLRVQSRWWITRRIDAGPKLVGGEEPGAGDGDLDLGDIASAAGDLFKNDTRPKGWEAVIYGASLPFGSLGPLPSSGSSVLAATRVVAPGDREVVIEVQHEQRPRQNARFVVLVWFNDKLVYDSRASEKEKPKPFRLREAGNTMVVECRSGEDGPATPGDVFVQFRDAKDGQRVEGLTLDIDQR